MTTTYTQKTINEILGEYDIQLWPECQRMTERHKSCFKNTHKVWFDGRFSTRYKIGDCMYLLNECNPKNKKEWVDYYFNSGDRAAILKQKRMDTKKFNHLNRYSGKTILELLKIAMELQELLKEYSLEQCFNYTFIRIIDEAYLGYQREKKSAKLLEDFCIENGFILNTANSYKDVVTGVDYEIKNLSNVLICGIQVKGSNANIKNANKIEMVDDQETVINRRNETVITNMNILKEKHQSYMEETGCSVLFMYIDDYNELENTDLFDEILSIAKSKNISINTYKTTQVTKNSQIDKFNKRFFKA